MVALKLVELNDDMVIYEYYPEGNEKYPGKIALKLKTKEKESTCSNIEYNH